MISWFQVGWPTVITDFLSAPLFRAKPKPERFAAEKDVVCEAFQAARNAAYRQSRAATKRGDTRGMNAASAEMQRLTTMQLRIQVGQQ